MNDQVQYLSWRDNWYGQGHGFKRLAASSHGIIFRYRHPPTHTLTLTLEVVQMHMEGDSDWRGKRP